MMDYESNRMQYEALHKQIRHRRLVEECQKAGQRPTLIGQATKLGAMLTTLLSNLLTKRELDLQNRPNVATR